MTGLSAPSGPCGCCSCKTSSLALTTPANRHPPLALQSCPTRLDGHGRESSRIAVLEDLTRDDEDDHVDIPASVLVVRHLV
eukprot:6212848-Pleurochrysis_carterae.AAC.3